MKLFYILLGFGLLMMGIDSCKDPAPDASIKFSGRLVEECAHVVAVPGVSLELWKDARPLTGNDSSVATYISSAVTDDGGYFVFNEVFDSVPMSLRMKDGKGGYIALARGVFGWHNYINTFNNIVADVLSKGNAADFKFSLTTPSGWKTGDSVVYRINDPNKAGGYVNSMVYGGQTTDTIRNIRAFTRIMENQLKLTELDRKFAFPVQADWFISGQKHSTEYWIPTNTCKGDSLHQFSLKF